MSLTRRRLFQRLATPDYSAQAEWISARGREAGMIEYSEQGTATGAAPIRIASNENPLGPGQHVLDAIVGKFPEAHRYPFNAIQHEGVLIKAVADKFQAQPENVLLGPGSGEILTHSVRAFTSESRPLVTAWPSFESPRDTAKKIGTPVTEVGFDGKLRIDIAKM
ncbi:MAG TPA: aminotransferase class I/II-fold pyridoxal phosphate-dependent enzyme, partial [Vicinamibacterales bacterium]|nr:aminotransferase class I/II-fold pyridoxal phosphate-dependent enzyme [Vicinamibacterales bacterium]